MAGASFAAALATVLAAVVVVAAQGPDHQAHAVPGDAQTVYDLDANGVEVVGLDGSLSHSHYFSAGPPVVNGQIVKYEWRNPGAPSGKTVLCSEVKCALTLPVGEHYIELTVTDQTGAAASAVVVVSVKSAGSAAGKPKVNSVSPSQGTTAGGQKVTILGSGFFGNVGVKFDATPAKSVTVVSENKLEAVSPAHVVGSAKVVVTTVKGDSNSGSFAYKDGGAAVSWREEVWRNADGSEWNVAEEVSGVAVGPDGRFYLSTLVGKVWAVDVGPDFVVRSACSGAEMGRAIYAIAWNPADKQKRLVVSTNTMWFRDAGSNWHSSKVEFVYIGGKNGECLTRGEVILDNLPMSNHDHGVSVFSFLDDGTMLVSVGAVTNAGVPAPGMGGSQETPLSAAIIQARYLEPGFNGQVMYSKWNESDQVTADQIGGDVSVYAAGLRSCFGMSRSLKGVLYATDNGGNTGFGPMSTSCSTSGEEPNVPDSLYVINKGNYYGHPNRNRGRYDERQCAWHGNGSTPSIAYMTSSTNGVLAYSGNAFGGQLKNTLFLTKMAWFGQPGKTLRVDLSVDGKSITDGPYEIWGDSGLSLAQGAAGELVMPQLKSKRVLVLVPEDGAAAGSVRMVSGPEVHYVHPPRGHASGGADVLVTGRGFEDVESVRLGEAACTNVRVLSETMLRCRIPAGVGSVTMSVTTSSGLASSSTGIDFAYAGATVA